MLFQLLGNEVFLGNLNLFFLQVARYINDFHTVEQGRVDVAQIVGRGDEEYLRQVESGLQIVVVEGVILLRVKHF